MLLELQQICGELNIGLQEILSILAIGLRITGVLLDIQPDCSTRAPSSGKTDDNARSIGELNIEALVGRHTSIEIGVRKVTGVSYCTVYGSY